MAVQNDGAEMTVNVMSISKAVEARPQPMPQTTLDRETNPLRQDVL